MNNIIEAQNNGSHHHLENSSHVPLLHHPDIDQIRHFQNTGEFQNGLRNLETARLGQALTIIAGHFSTAWSNVKLIEHLKSQGFPQDQLENAQQQVERSGFRNRFISEDLLNSPIEDVVIRTALINAHLLIELMKDRKWDSIDAYIDASSIMPLNINELSLRLAGLDPEKIEKKSYRMACAGWSAGFIGSLEQQNFGKRIVIASSEPLSSFIDTRHFQDLSGLMIPAIFGDRYLAAAVNPQAFNPLYRSVNIFDDEGVIKIHTEYDFYSLEHDKTSIPPYYRFGENGQFILKHTPDYAVLSLTTPENNSPASMDGINTAFVFGNNTTDDLMQMAVALNKPDLYRNGGIKNKIIHPASLGVVSRIAKKLKIAGYLDQRELPFTPTQFGDCNTSSASTPTVIQRQIQLGNIDPDYPLIIASPGVGAAIVTACLEIDKNYLE